MLKKLKNQNKGITLIALVITIIVLLILAGIGISMLSGDNNILKRAGDAKDKTELESLKEEAKIVMSNRTIEKTTMGTNSKTLKQDLESGISGGQAEEITKADGTTKYTDVCYVSKNGQTITVYEDGEVLEGKVSIWKGATDIECPKFEKDANKENVWNWYIYTAGQLKFLADFVNNGNSLNGTENGADLNDYVNDPSIVTMSTDTTIYLMNNLDLGARPGAGATDEEKWKTNPDSLKWMPIGIDNSNVQNKLGTFEGNNHTICGVYVNRDVNNNGIFGYSNSVQNLTIKNSYIKGAKLIGGIVGYLNEGKIYNCKNDNTTIMSKTYAGGIAGVAKGKIEKCTNNGNIIASATSGSWDRVGGIVGDAYNDVENCINNGKITGNEYCIGGVAGSTRASASLIGCCNNGVVNGNGYTSGIVGYNLGKKITNCINNGEVSGDTQVGGIVGRDGNSYNDSEINGCTNNGKINAVKQYIGGIAGICQSKIVNCNNTGNINGKVIDIGGIVGSTNKNITECTNSGIIRKELYIITSSSEYTIEVGGIAGFFSGGEISNCINNGYIDANNAGRTGGIVGCCTSSGTLTIKRCINIGKIKADNLEGNSNSGVQGGLVGVILDTSGWSITNSYNSAPINGYWGVGGIIGAAHSAGNIKNCYNIGKVNGSGYLGGIIGDNSTSNNTFTNSYYLEGTATLDAGSGSTNNLAKNKEFITQDFVTTANATETIWKVEAGKNDGWPILNE